jgi:hypothetical protein
VPRLLTKEEYIRRGRKWQHEVARFNAGKITKAALKGEMWDSQNVVGVSQLTRLPYFDIVKQSLYDMMHLTAGLVGRNCIDLVKGNRATGNKRPKVAPPEAGEAPPDPGVWRYPKSKKEAWFRAEENTYFEWQAAEKKMTLWKMELRLRTFEKLFGELNEEEVFLMDGVYDLIRAPLNIAPKSKYPFRLRGEMTAYHWLNFTKVYGKYLFFARYSKPTDGLPFKNAPHRMNTSLDGLCQLMDLLTSCLASHATTDTKARTDELVKEFATRFDEMLPITEKVINMHNLIFHIPDMIKRWGPVRGFWCFPFERSAGVTHARVSIAIRMRNRCSQCSRSSRVSRRISSLILCLQNGRVPRENDQEQAGTRREHLSTAAPQLGHPTTGRHRLASRQRGGR